MALYTRMKDEITIRKVGQYSGQIHPYNGKVIAEVLNCYKAYRDEDMWLAVSYKFFGSGFRRSPREKDYVAATEWLNKQLDLIEKYATTTITKPEFIRDIERANEIKKK